MFITRKRLEEIKSHERWEHERRLDREREISDIRSRLWELEDKVARLWELEDKVARLEMKMGNVVTAKTTNIPKAAPEVVTPVCTKGDWNDRA